MSQDFLWGVATSSHQIDGNNRHNDWWDWESRGVIDGGVRSGAACDHVHRFREDLRLAKTLGLNTYRFSFEWSRLEPREGEWDSAEFDWYHELLDECDALGLIPMATLHHFTTPKWVADLGGFTFEKTPEKFACFVSKVIEAFGPRIPLWCTINEPMVLVVGGYLGRFMPPGDYDPKGASAACHNLLKSHVLAYDLLKNQTKPRTGPFRERPLEVGFAHNMLRFKPERRMNPIEHVLTRILSRVYNDAWLKGVNGERQSFGFPGFFPLAPQVTEARGRRTYDFIGLNYYTKAYVRFRPQTPSKERVEDIPIGMTFAKRRDEASDLGWALHPKGLRLMLDRLAKYKAPIYITENGIADAHDTLRSRYLHSHLLEVARARERGIDVRGYYHWSLMDNFEWIKGFWPRFGLFAVDYETLDRHPRPSADYYRKLIEAHAQNQDHHGAPHTEILGNLSPDLTKS